MRCASFCCVAHMSTFSLQKAESKLRRSDKNNSCKQVNGSSTPLAGRLTSHSLKRERTLAAGMFLETFAGQRSRHEAVFSLALVLSSCSPKTARPAPPATSPRPRPAPDYNWKGVGHQHWARFNKEPGDSLPALVSSICELWC